MGKYKKFHEGSDLDAFFNSTWNICFWVCPHQTPLGAPHQKQQNFFAANVWGQLLKICTFLGRPPPL